MNTKNGASITGTIWQWLDAGDYPPPEVKRGARYAEGRCWLCGADAGPEGWPKKAAFGPTFTEASTVAEPDSAAVCQPCAALTSSGGWAQYVRAHPERGFETNFPLKPGKTTSRPLSWLYSGHVFTPTSHETPSWKRWRTILASPPEPPFVAVFAVSQKQQIIHRSMVASSASGRWPLQVEQRRVCLELAETHRQRRTRTPVQMRTLHFATRVSMTRRSLGQLNSVY